MNPETPLSASSPLAIAVRLGQRDGLIALRDILAARLGDDVDPVPAAAVASMARQLQACLAELETLRALPVGRSKVEELQKRHEARRAGIKRKFVADS